MLKGKRKEMFKKWLPNEIQFLKEQWRILPVQEISNYLVRTPVAIKKKAKKLSLPPLNRWSLTDVMFLRDNWGLIPTIEIGIKLNKTISSVRAKAERLKLPNQCLPWSDHEKGVLAEYYGHLPIEIIAAFLCRTVSSCKNMVFKLQHDPAFSLSDKPLKASFKLHADLLKEKWKDQCYRERMALMSKSLWEDENYRSNRNYDNNSLRKRDPDFLRKFYAGRQVRPTRPEKLLDGLLQKYFPKEFAYNGDYSRGVTLGGLIPDFINVNGKKLVIEVFGDYWHDDKRRKIPWKSTEFGRKSVYSQLGFDCIIIWERQLNNPNLVIEEVRSYL